MSHAATNWLSALLADEVSHAEFRVLFHLCDCHNAAQGCFPTQKFLSGACGMARSTVNVALASLEEKGLIQRHQSIDERTRRQRPTRYILGFEMGSPQEPCPEIGHGKPNNPRPGGRTRAVSGISQKPCPEIGKSRVRTVGHKPVIKPVREPGAAKPDTVFDAEREVEVLAWWAEKISGGGFIPQSAISPAQAQKMIGLSMVTAAQLKAVGISC